MRITQIYSNFGYGFKEALIQKYGFTDQIDHFKPVFMFGCYWTQQITWACKFAGMSGLCVICWAGTDAKDFVDPRNKIWIDIVKSTPGIKHIAPSKWIADDLRSVGIPFYEIPVTTFKLAEINPQPLGDSIFMYKPFTPIYNGGIYHELKSRLPYNFIEAPDCRTFNREQLMEVYKRCFLGLRFTEHDGMSEIVSEMGLMGRMVIHNGKIPNCIPYDKNDIDSIIEVIHAEYKYFHDLGLDKTKQVAKDTFDYLNIPDDFLNTEYYE
jgi:hypothetical protein